MKNCLLTIRVPVYRPLCRHANLQCVAAWTWGLGYPLKSPEVDWRILSIVGYLQIIGIFDSRRDIVNGRAKLAEGVVQVTRVWERFCQ